MKLKFNGFLTLLLVLLTQITFAQDRTVAGVVTDESGLPIPGVNVLVKGTSNGVQTDFDGKFKIAASLRITSPISFIKNEEKPCAKRCQRTVSLYFLPIRYAIEPTMSIMCTIKTLIFITSQDIRSPIAYC